MGQFPTLSLSTFLGPPPGFRSAADALPGILPKGWGWVCQSRGGRIWLVSRTTTTCCAREPGQALMLLTVGLISVIIRMANPSGPAGG